MINLYSTPLVIIFLVGLALILVASEIGHQLGVHAASRGGKSVSTMESAILGLLALMIGFTFAMALARFDARRDAVLNEANAIGTTALRARLLPEPHRSESLKLLREYVQVRIAVTNHVAAPAEFKIALDRSNAIQEALWQQAKAIAAKDTGLVPTGLFIQTLNDMIDNQEKRLAGMRNRVPSVVLLGLFAVAAVAAGFTGYGRGLEARGRRLSVVIMSVLIAAVILLILDLDRPGDGFIAVSQQPMIDTAAGIAGFTD